MVSEKIEILSVDLLDQNRQYVEALQETASGLKLEFGWHYLLDLTWILNHLEAHLGDLKDRRVMDAGAGTGILQWFLAEQGAEIASIDRLSRAALPMRFRARYRIEGLRPGDLLSPAETLAVTLNKKTAGPFYRRWLAKTKYMFGELLYLIYGVTRTKAPGRICIYNQDLSDLKNIPDESLDAIVAVSSLEHNTPEGLVEVVEELMRVLKSGGILLATLVAGQNEDWWHEASSAWCYSDDSLRRIFNLPDDTPSNYQRHDELLAELRNCSELRENLASFYYRSGENGMPWGKWDPQYQPVGVCKIKT
jgi:SAM-dependent methyltransferase